MSDNKKKPNLYKEFDDFENINNGVVIDGMYVHYKGGAYIVHSVALNTFTQEPHVVYQSVNTGHWFTRPKDEFLEVLDELTGEMRFTLYVEDDEDS